ncbi:MAG: hydroxymethylglutaryl-CoA reductase, degradative [Candidatus Micrarchaeota archaeon]|nr:hydroxymethylglutaryl-CoA reductase, degradative [Candidatus Micrarchaeota archaeon]
MANETKTSAISGFYKLTRSERIGKVARFSALTEEQKRQLASDSPLGFEVASRMAENALGLHAMPLCVATNFLVNGKEVLVPMAIEEPSVVAAASNGAKLCRDSGGFFAVADAPIMVGQVQIVGANDAQKAVRELNSKKAGIISAAEPFAAGIAKYGGGIMGFSARALPTERGEMAIAEFDIDVRDSMGANTVNTILEGVAPKIEEISGGKVRLRILSNLAVKRLVKARAVWKRGTIGADCVEGVLDGWAFADADIYRACTHNKGIMNGIDAVAVATGNDWRAVEAGAHAFAAAGGRYRPLTRFKKLANGDLEGEIELPMAVGIVGGATRSLPSAQAALAILGVKTSQELACVMASAGLAQNFAALRALSTEGIQRGHMELHAKNLAIASGASGEESDRVAARMIGENDISAKKAAELLEKERRKK